MECPEVNMQLVGRVFVFLSATFLSCEQARHGVEPMLFLTNWFMSLFTNLSEWETVLHIWDLFLLEGTRALFRVSIALLKASKGKKNRKKKKKTAN
jgi:hypothetical protein